MDINQIIEQHALWLDTDGEEGSRANLYGANLTRANLTRANLDGANLIRANLYGANLIRANLYGANLYGANLYGANLTRANLYGANLYGANLYGANLYGANLTRTDLYGANLDGANLDGAIGNLNHLKSVFCETYPVTYTAEVMQIGCQRHKLEEWWSFDDARIIEMDGKKALKWWRTWKPILQQIIATSPATATGYVENNTDENKTIITAAALIGIALLFAFALAGTMDIESENHNRDMYCEMTALYAESNGQYGWPPYEDSVQCP